MNMNKNLLYTLWSAAIVLCVALSVFALLFSACAKAPEPQPSVTPGFDVQTAPPDAPVETDAPAEPTEPPATLPPATRLSLTADAGREYLDKIIFLGDSTTYGIGYYYNRGYTDLCPPSQVWTPKSGTLTLSYYNVATIVYPETEEELLIVDAVERAKPELMVITLGVNGVSFMNEQEFTLAYTALVNNIQAASPDTKIILNSIYPVAKTYQYLDQINNDKICAANGWIERIAEATGCRYLNTYEAVVGDDGNLPANGHNGDGMHLTGETFGTVMEYIRTHAYQ